MILPPGRRLSDEEKQEYLAKCYSTRKQHGTFNTSEAEDRLYRLLCEQYGESNVRRQYRDKIRYPFRCDFYIPSEDLFIEANLHWTHGGRPFREDDPECLTQLLDWQRKAATSKFYENAIQTWTVRDVLKLQSA